MAKVKNQAYANKVEALRSEVDVELLWQSLGGVQQEFQPLELAAAFFSPDFPAWVPALSEDDPCATVAHHQKEHEFAHFDGQLVVLVSAPVRGHKIPVWEQELSCGAAAMNLLLAAHALGFVAGWVTGWRAYSERVRAAFCEPGERIAGFVFIGNAGHELEERERPSPDAVRRSWRPPAL